MRTALLVGMLAAAAVPAGAQERLADQLRKGIAEEEVSQNLEKAIQSYQAIVARYDEDRKAAGTALYRLAECYRKAGKREQAIAAYRRVAREFADHAAIAEPSREQLAALGVSEAREVRPERASAAEVRERIAAERRLRTEPARRAPRAEASAEVTKLELELKAMQQRLAQAEKLIQRGLLSPADYEKLKAEYTALQFRYQEQLVEREAREGADSVEAKISQAEEVLAGQRVAALDQRVADMKKRVAEAEAFVKKVEAMKQRPANYDAIVAEWRNASAELEKARAEYMTALTAYQRQREEARARQREAQDRRLLNERLMKSVQSEILLVEQRITYIERQVAVGTASPQDTELLQLRRDLLGLRRKLDEISLQLKLDGPR